MIFRKHIVFFTAFILAAATGLIFDYLYNQSPEHPFSKETIEKRIKDQIYEADISANNFMADSLFTPGSVEKEMPGYSGTAFYFYKQDQLLYWNTNEFEIDLRSFKKDGDWHLVQLGNSDVIGKWYAEAENGILAVIPVKSNYQFENKYLKNEFNSNLSIDKNIGISDIQSPGSVNILSPDGKFLFALETDTQPVYNETYRIIGFFAFGLALLLFFLGYCQADKITSKRYLSELQYWGITTIAGTGILASCYFNIPALFFSNSLFSPYQYAANNIVSSFTHLTVICLFAATSVYVYRQKTIKPEKTALFRKVLFFIYLFFFFEILKSLILHSGISFNIILISDINFINIWAHFLVFILGVGLYLFYGIVSEDDKKHPGKSIITNAILFVLSVIIYFIISKDFTLLFITFMGLLLIFGHLWTHVFHFKSNFTAASLYIILITLLTVSVTYRLNNYKKTIKYKILSENILINGNSENDPIAEVLLEELDKNLHEDLVIRNLMQSPDSVDEIRKYIFNNYLRGFWNKYDIRIIRISANSPEYVNYINFLSYIGKKLTNTDFYNLPASLYDLSIIGLIRISDNQEKKERDNGILVLEFQPKRNFKSYSFPDLLISNSSYLAGQSSISIAKFEHDELIYSDSKYDWSDIQEIFPRAPEGFSKIKFHQKDFYIFTGKDSRIIITELKNAGFSALLFYFIFALLAFLLAGRILFWIYEINTLKRDYTLGVTSRFQLVFISLLFISFLGTLVFSVNHFRSSYQQEQIASIQKKKEYIQKSLQDMYYWTEDITSVDTQGLNNDLEELSYRYQTDINIYDNTGKLAGSSQTLIFRKNLLSRLMAPEVYFTNLSVENQYEKIGELTYLSAYTEMINGDYLRIGYISIPQYLSQTEINTKIESFLGSIIQIYLIIALLSIILIVITGKRLSDPLSQLEEKLKMMRLDGKNEKIEYQRKDEIGHLVEQYNKTVDELEKSTQLLLKSERESAWRTMARQIAHEINNPLTPMKLTIQQLQRTRQLNDSSFEAYFNKATSTLIEQIDNLSRIAGTFSQFARLPETRFTDVDIAAKLYSVTELFRNNHEKISIHYEGPANGVFISGDSDQMTQVLNNLLKNATQAIPGDKKGAINTRLSIAEKEITITINDNGTGIPVSNQQEIFKPNFTTKSTGMGLGLSISKNIIDNMGGKISFTTQENEGTTFTIILKKKDTIVSG